VCLMFSKHTVITGVLLWLYWGCLLVVVDAFMVAYIHSFTYPTLANGVNKNLTIRQHNEIKLIYVAY